MHRVVPAGFLFLGTACVPDMPAYDRWDNPSGDFDEDGQSQDDGTIDPGLALITADLAGTGNLDWVFRDYNYDGQRGRIYIVYGPVTGNIDPLVNADATVTGTSFLFQAGTRTTASQTLPRVPTTRPTSPTRGGKSESGPAPFPERWTAPTPPTRSMV